jgi:glycosyltransferase involved in cell wall biosynthesis
MIENKQTISIILPVHNEEGNLGDLIVELNKLIESENERYDIELLFVDDGSTDGSYSILKAQAERNTSIKVISFTRNFGHQLALRAGYDHCDSNIVVSMDSDMQDPPLLVSPMLRKYEEGYSIVYAFREKRFEPTLRLLIIKSFYFLFTKMVPKYMFGEASDFRLVTREIVEIIRLSRPDAHFIRGLVAWTGFDYACVPYDRPNRTKDQSSYSLLSLLELGLTGLILHSRFSVLIGVLFLLLFGVSLILYFLNLQFLVVVFPLFIFALVTFVFLIKTMGTSNRPLYVIRETINI